MYVQNILLWTYEDIANSFYNKKNQCFFINKKQIHFFLQKDADLKGQHLLLVFQEAILPQSKLMYIGTFFPHLTEIAQP